MQKINESFKLKGKFTIHLKDLQGNILEEHIVENLVVNLGKEVFARLIAGDTTFSGGVNYLAAGTDASSPAVTDALLGNEIDRSEVDSIVRTGNQASLDFIFSATQAIGDLKELGAFIDGTLVADTGQLFDRVNIDITKTGLNSLTVNLVVTVL